MLMCPVGLRSQKGCDSHYQQKLETADPTSRPRARPNSQLSKNN
jgi:hypothetical protein